MIDRAELGGLIFNMVVPSAGCEPAWREWYAHDHYYAGAMAGPGVVSGRLWAGVAAWTPDGGTAHPDGSYLGTYFLLAGTLSDYQEWSATQHPRLAGQGRMFTDRRQVHRGRYMLAAVSRGPAAGAAAISALDRDFPALVAMLVEPRDVEPASAHSKAAADSARPGSVGIELCFDPLPGGYSEVATPEHRLILSFQTSTPNPVSAAIENVAIRGQVRPAWAGLFRPLSIADLALDAR